VAEVPEAKQADSLLSRGGCLPVKNTIEKVPDTARIMVWAQGYMHVNAVFFGYPTLATEGLSILDKITCVEF
jgi:hypothetical protein